MKLNYWWRNEEWFVVPASVTTVVATVGWAKLTSNARGWGTTTLVSVETRFNRVYPQVNQQAHIPFIWRIQTQFPFYVASGSGVFIRSSITESLY